MLDSVEDVIEALGGTAAAAKLAGVGPSAVSNWKTRGIIPAANFMAFSRALARSRKPEPVPAVFGFKPAKVRR